MPSRRDLTLCLLSATLAVASTLAVRAAVDAARPLIGESAFDFTTLAVQKTPVGETRSVVKGPTATLDELEMHITTLNPGMASHPPHRHPNEELVILDSGTVEVLIDGQWKRLGPGSIVLNASNVLHGLRNVGATPAQYHVINWRTDKTPRE
jgi:quercetin dioxygenase-like cupin family protein